MLNDHPAETVSARKIILAVVVATLLIGLTYFSRESLFKTSEQTQCITNKNLATTLIRAGGEQVEAEVAVTGEEHALGLSGRDCLAPDSGMLFVYSLPGDYCFWMNDMNFAIDMIWLDDEKRVVTIKGEISPSTYPQNFCPDKPAQYVLEVPAGYAAASGWGEGMEMFW